MGWVGVRGSNPCAPGAVKNVHLASGDGRKWIATISYEVEAPDVADDGLAVGVDMNCGQVAASTGDIIHAPDVARLEARRRRHQRRMARQRKGGKRRQRTRERMAKAARRKRDIGRNWRHRVSRTLADTAGLVVVEDLATAKMTRRAKGSGVRQKAGLNRSILATGWGELRSMIEYKAAHVVAVDPRNTSRTCHQCGHVDKGNRTTQADFCCLECGHAGNADINAARNTLAPGNGASGRREALALATSKTRQLHGQRCAA